MKLSEPQQWVLRTMIRRNWHVEIISLCRRSWATYWMSADFCRAHFVRQPNARTLQSLERKGLLGRDREDSPIFKLILTPKGRKVAKEEQDAEDD